MRCLSPLQGRLDRARATRFQDELAIRQRFQNPRLYLAGIRLTVCLLALMPLWDLSKNFSFDWYNHLWESAYSGRFMWTHGYPPCVLNTPDAVGMPNPLFYGSTFHVLVGCLGRFIGVSMAFRLLALGLLLTQFLHIERAAREISASRIVAMVVATAASWQVYQMVAIYDRGDLTEFTALVCLTCSLTCLVVLCLRIAKGDRDPYGLIATGAFYGLATIIHPLTGLFGGILVAALGLSAMLVLKSRKLLLFGAVNFLALSCLLSPWLYLVTQFGKLIRITDSSLNSFLFQGLFASTIIWKSLASAFSPISGSYYARPDPSGMPYQTSVQFSLSLLVFSILTLAVLSRCPKRCARPEYVLCGFLGVSYLTFLVSLLVFCVPKCSSLFGGLFDIMQFSYRLGAYVNLSLILCSLCLSGLIAQDKLQSQGRIGMVWKCAGAGALLLAAIALASKTIVIQSSCQFGSGADGVDSLLRMKHWPTQPGGYWVPGNAAEDTVHLDDLPAMFYCRSDYDVRSGFATNYSELNGLPVCGAFFRPGAAFGEVSPLNFTLTKPTLLVTNVNVFPWNAIYLDGKRVPSGNLFPAVSKLGLQWSSPEALALRAGPGQHVLRYAFRPRRPWLYLRGFSWLVLAAWTALWAAAVGAKLSRSNQPAI